MDLDLVDIFEIRLQILICVLILNPNLLVVRELAGVIYHICGIYFKVIATPKGVDVSIMSLFVLNGSTRMLAHCQNINTLF